MTNEIVTFFGKKYRVSTLHKYSPRRKLRLFDPRGGWRAYLTGMHANSYSGDTAQEAVSNLEREVLKEFRKLAKVCGYEVSE